MRWIGASALLLLLTTAASGQDWPSFRGPHASGVADGQDLPADWDAGTGRNIRWYTRIPGRSHASPVIWGDQILVLSAVAQNQKELVLGDEGGIDTLADTEEYSWRLYSIDKHNGDIGWMREAYRGVPRTRRHVKASQANSTPATDGEVIVSIFGSEGMVAFDMQGNELWRVDLGNLDAGLYGDPTSQWGHSSSPIIWKDLVLVQVDRHTDSFIAAYNRRTGDEIWKIGRDEKPIWATPTIHESDARTQMIVMGGTWDRGLDPRTGQELWRFARDLEVKTTTPIVAGGLVILSGGYRGKNLQAIRVGAEGDVSLADGAKSSASVAWTSEPGGPYTSTPVAYRDTIYFARNTGVIAALDLATGEEIFRDRVDSTYSASPVASDGKIYLAGEDGVLTVIRAGRTLEVLARNDMGEPLMASPAISDGTLFVRSGSGLYAISTTAAEARDEARSLEKSK